MRIKFNNLLQDSILKSIWLRIPLYFIIIFLIFHYSKIHQEELLLYNISNWREFCYRLKNKTDYPYKIIWSSLSNDSKYYISNPHLIILDEENKKYIMQEIVKIFNSKKIYNDSLLTILGITNINVDTLGNNNMRKLNFITFEYVLNDIISPSYITSIEKSMSHIFNKSIMLGIISLLLAFFALEFSFFHSKSLNKMNNLISETLGLESYIGQAAEIYKEEDAIRVVTSLKHWVATGRSAEIIEEGLRASQVNEIIFVGSIHWNVYFTGVMWRFITFKRYLKKDQTGRIIHVTEGIPLFVVSKRKNPTPNNRGSLLIANPTHLTSTKLYGINLGSSSPKQVDHYNFLFDTLICPQTVIKNIWGNIKNVTNIDYYEHCDGLERIFRDVSPFKIEFNNGVIQHTGFIYSNVDVSSIKEKEKNSIQERVVDDRADYLAGQILKMIDKFEGFEEKNFLSSDFKFHKNISKNFIISLLEAKILKIEEENNNAFLRVCNSYNNNYPNCGDYFIRKGN